nr:MAG TPA_asm: hypothetical protein [Caudoviricetes sp.]
MSLANSTLWWKGGTLIGWVEFGRPNGSKKSGPRIEGCKALFISYGYKRRVHYRGNRRI